MTPKFFGQVSKAGVLNLRQPVQFRNHLKSLAGKQIEIVVRRLRNSRSLQANRYYFGIVVPLLAEEFGYEKNEMHEVLAMRFLRIEDCPITGAPRRKRTPSCDTREFSDYVDSCIRLAAEHGVVVPAPNEAVSA